MGRHGHPRRREAMTTFTVWKFKTPEGAAHASSLLKDVEREGLIKVLDHAVVSWPAGETNPRVTHGRDDVKRGVGWGSLWGVVLGAMFAVPVIGLAAGGALGAWSKAAEKLGITKEQIEEIRAELTEGTSALFVVSDHGELDRLGERFRGVHMSLIQTNLTEAERAELLEIVDTR
jgi:uncharacterized membrane protein